MANKQVTSALKGLRQLARACAQEASICETAAALVVADDHLHAKNAKVWRGRQRVCWKAMRLLEAWR